MEQIVKRKDKSSIKTFFVIILFVILIDFIIFIMNRYTENLPYITTILTIFLVVIACSYILIKYFSKYSYTLDKQQLIFHRVIGKRKFEMLRIDLINLIDIEPYIEKSNKNPNYKFIFDEQGDNIYIGRYKSDKCINTFLFSPNEEILKGLKTRSENNG